MNNRLRASLFLMEQLIVILIFALCATVCIKIFVTSYIMASDSKDMNNAVIVAESVAECYKATAGDVDKMAVIFKGDVVNTKNKATVNIYYDKDWQICDKNRAAFGVVLTRECLSDYSTLPMLAVISIVKITGEEIISLTAASRRVT